MMNLYARWSVWSDPEASAPKEYNYGGRVVDYVANGTTIFALIMVPSDKGYRLEQVDIQKITVTMWAEECIRIMKEKRDGADAA